MTKLLMMIALACTVQAVAIYGQKEEGEPRDQAPLYFYSKEEVTQFRETTEHVEVKTFYAPRRVCTQADAPRPGARFFGGPCAENARLKIPMNNTPAWDCEQVHGVGNCMLVQRPKAGEFTVNKEWKGTFDDLRKDPLAFNPQKLEPFYVPKCQADFRLVFVVVQRGAERNGVADSLDLWPVWALYCARDRQDAK